MRRDNKATDKLLLRSGKISRPSKKEWIISRTRSEMVEGNRETKISITLSEDCFLIAMIVKRISRGTIIAIIVSPAMKTQVGSVTKRRTTMRMSIREEKS
jgi:hypothetical protein